MKKERFLTKLLLKRGTHQTFNAIRVLKKNISTFRLHKLSIKYRVSIVEVIFSTVDEILWKKRIHFT